MFVCVCGGGGRGEGVWGVWGVFVFVCVYFISVLSPFGVTCNAVNVKISEFPLTERHASIEMHGIKCK